MYTFNYEEGQDIKLLVSRFEKMMRTNNVGFLEQRAWKRLLDYYEDEGAISKAMDVVNHAIRQHPYSSNFYIRKAQFLADNDSFVPALDCLEQAEIFNPSELEIYLTRAEIYTSQEQYKKALAVLDERKNNLISQDLDELYLAYANVYEDMQQYHNAFHALKKTLEINPQCESALERIWLCTEMCEYYETSIALHNKILDEDAYSHWAWYNLGHAHLSLGQHETASEAFEYAYTIKENFWIAYREHGETLMALKNYQGAIQCYERALKDSSSLFDIHFNIGQCYEAIEDYTKARKHYFAAIHIAPESSLAFYRIGECYIDEEKWEAGIKAFERALTLEPDNADYLLGIGEAYTELEDYESAEKFYQRAVDAEPDNVNTWVDYISFLAYIEEYARGIDITEEALGYCDDLELAYCVAGIYYLAGYRKEALNRLQILLIDHPNTEHLLFETFPYLAEDLTIQTLIANCKA